LSGTIPLVSVSGLPISSLEEVHNQNTMTTVPKDFNVGTRYEPVRLLGSGSYGVVCSALDTYTGEAVAIKKIVEIFDNCSDARRLLREIRLLRHLSHKNVIAMRDILRPVDERGFNELNIVYELMDTDLHQVIRSSQVLSDDHCQYFIYQVSFFTIIRVGVSNCYSCKYARR
jgi:serine/threonine protein kinase